MVAHILGEVKTGDEFEHFGPHITLLPWFRTTEHRALLGFEEAVQDIEKFNVGLVAVKIGQITMLGESYDTPALSIPEAISLGVMHGLLLARLGKYYKDSESSRYVGKYNPHITIKDGMPELPEGYCADSLCLVRHDDTHKTIVGAEKL